MRSGEKGKKAVDQCDETRVGEGNDQLPGVEMKSEQASVGSGKKEHGKEEDRSCGQMDQQE